MVPRSDLRRWIDWPERGGFDDPEKYAAIEAYLDIGQFIDYVILNWYAGNQDWGHTNWFAVYKNPSGRVKYFAWDSEVTWIQGSDDYLGANLADNQPNLLKTLFRQLMANSDFRMMFTDHLYKHFFNNGALTDANAQARWMRINDLIDPAIVGESARWGDTRYEAPITRDDWLKARDHVLAQMAGNAHRFLALRLDDYGWYPEFNPPDLNPPGGIVSPGLTVDMSPAEGMIYYTVNGSDPQSKSNGGGRPVSLSVSGTARYDDHNPYQNTHFTGWPVERLE